MKKVDEMSNLSSCFNKAKPDEIIFVLRANDPIAPKMVRFWAAHATGIHESSKINEALRCAIEMENWRFEQNLKRREQMED